MTTTHEPQTSSDNEQARIRWADDEAAAIEKAAQETTDQKGGFIRAINWLYKTTPGRIVAGGVAGAAVVTAVVLGPRGGGASDGGLSEPLPTNSQGVDSGPGTVDQPPVDQPETNGPSTSEIAAHQIEAGQSPEATGQAILTELTEWEMAGAAEFNTQWLAEVAKTADASDAAFSKFLNDFVDKKTVIYATALFGPNYASNPDVQAYLKGQVLILKRNLTLNQATVAGGTPYVQSMQLEGAPRFPAPNQQEFDVTIIDNAVESGADKLITNTTTGGNTYGGEKDTIRTETQEVDGKVIIVKISIDFTQ